MECADRGKLLDVVSKRYKRLFARIPSILSELQQEIDGLVDANKSLRMLLERLMEEKSIIGVCTACLPCLILSRASIERHKIKRRQPL